MSSADFPRPSVTVDLVLMTVREGGLFALLQKRAEAPFQDDWALPGGFVGIEESLDEAASRILAAKAGLHDAYVEQLYSFGAPNRDPREQVITIAYFALLPTDRFDAALSSRRDLMLARLIIANPDKADAAAGASGPDGKALRLAFDHSEILGHAIRRLRGKLDYSRIAFALLPEQFTLRALQDVHEAILDRRLNKPAFRRRMLDTGWIKATGQRESGAAFRPAELYSQQV